MSTSRRILPLLAHHDIRNLTMILAIRTARLRRIAAEPKARIPRLANRPLARHDAPLQLADFGWPRRDTRPKVHQHRMLHYWLPHHRRHRLPPVMRGNRGGVGLWQVDDDLRTRNTGIVRVVLDQFA